jgi:hypothetical protein
MKRFNSIIISALFFSVAALAGNPIVITNNDTGSIVENLTKVTPDESGMVLTREIQLPAFKRGAYYRPFSTSSDRGGVARGNRVEAVAFKSISELQAYQPSTTRKDHTNVQQGQFMLLELKDGRYLALLPMASE